MHAYTRTGLPGAIGGTGYVTGSVMIVLGAAFSANGLILLTRAAQQAGLPSSFYSVARAAVPEFTVLIDLAVALKCFGVATGYLILIGDCMVDALDHLLLLRDADHEVWWMRLVLTRQFWIVGALVAVLAVSFFRTLDALKTASAMALSFVVFLVVGIVAYAQGYADPCLDLEYDVCVGPIERSTTIARTVAKLPIFIFSFTCHQNIFPVVNEIRQRSQMRLNTVVLCSVGICRGPLYYRCHGRVPNLWIPRHGRHFAQLSRNAQCDGTAHLHCPLGGQADAA